MPSTAPRHRSRASFDELLSQLDDHEVHLLLTELNNSRDVHIPVAKAINFYERPYSPPHGHGHGLLPKRAVSSPFLTSHHHHHGNLSLRRDDTPPVPPIPTALLPATTIVSRKPLMPLAPQTIGNSLNKPTLIDNGKRISSAPLLNGPSRSPPRPQTAESDATPASPNWSPVAQPASPGWSPETLPASPSWRPEALPASPARSPSRHPEALPASPTRSPEALLASPAWSPEPLPASPTRSPEALPASPIRRREALPPPITVKTSRAYKRISRPLLSPSVTQGQDLRALLAAHLFNGGELPSLATLRPSLNTARSMVDLRMFERQQQEEAYYRPDDLLEPMVLGTRAPGAAPPSVLGRPLLRDAPDMDSLFMVLNDS